MRKVCPPIDRALIPVERDFVLTINNEPIDKHGFWLERSSLNIGASSLKLEAADVPGVYGSYDTSLRDNSGRAFIGGRKITFTLFTVGSLDEIRESKRWLGTLHGAVVNVSWRVQRGYFQGTLELGEWGDMWEASGLTVTTVKCSVTCNNPFLQGDDFIRVPFKKIQDGAIEEAPDIPTNVLTYVVNAVLDVLSYAPYLVYANQYWPSPRDANAIGVQILRGTDKFVPTFDDNINKLSNVPSEKRASAAILVLLYGAYRANTTNEQVFIPDVDNLEGNRDFIPEYFHVYISDVTSVTVEQENKTLTIARQLTGAILIIDMERQIISVTDAAQNGHVAPTLTSDFFKFNPNLPPSTIKINIVGHADPDTPPSFWYRPQWMY